MIDWYFLFSNALWIAGASIALGAFSYHRWLVREAPGPARPPAGALTRCVALGLCLVCLGLALLEGARWWERVIWFTLAAVFIHDVAMSRDAGPGSPTGRAVSSRL